MIKTIARLLSSKARYEPVSEELRHALHESVRGELDETFCVTRSQLLALSAPNVPDPTPVQRQRFHSFIKLYPYFKKNPECLERTHVGDLYVDPFVQSMWNAFQAGATGGK